MLSSLAFIVRQGPLCLVDCSNSPPACQLQVDISCKVSYPRSLTNFPAFSPHRPICFECQAGSYEYRLPVNIVQVICWSGMDAIADWLIVERRLGYKWISGKGAIRCDKVEGLKAKYIDQQLAHYSIYALISFVTSL